MLLSLAAQPYYRSTNPPGAAASFGMLPGANYTARCPRRLPDAPMRLWLLTAAAYVLLVPAVTASLELPALHRGQKSSGNPPSVLQGASKDSPGSASPSDSAAVQSLAKELEKLDKYSGQKFISKHVENPKASTDLEIVTLDAARPCNLPM